MKHTRKFRTSSGRRLRKFAWIAGTSATVIALLYWEQAGLLYVLATLAMSALLLVVAFSNLEARDAELHKARQRENASAHDADSESSASGKKRAA